MHGPLAAGGVLLAAPLLRGGRAVGPYHHDPRAFVLSPRAARVSGGTPPGPRKQRWQRRAAQLLPSSLASESVGLAGGRAAHAGKCRGAAWVPAILLFARFLAPRDEPFAEPRAEAVIIRKKRNPYIPQPGRYKSTDWYANLRGMPSSTLLRCIRGPIICTGMMAVLVSALYFTLEPRGQFRTLGLQAHGLLGSALGLLLVFRTNTAYSRFWEGRRIWERILHAGRDLSRYAVTLRREIGNESAARICRLVEAFPYCMIEHLRGRADKHLRKKLERLVGDPSAGVEDALPLSSNRPLFIVNRLAATIAAVPNEEGGQAMFTNRERCMLLGIVQTLSQTIGECERIVQTPVPLMYVRHTSRFLSIFMFTLPYALVDQCGAITAVVTMLASWALFGILEIGLMIEDPFQKVLKVEVVADTLERDIFETIRFEGAEEMFQLLGRWGVEPLAKSSWAGAALLDMASEAPPLTAADTEACELYVAEAEGSGPVGGDAALEDPLVQACYTEDGKIPFDVFRRALQSVDADRWTDAAIQEVFDKADTDLDGTISFEEWCTIIRRAGGMKVSRMPSSKPLPADLYDADRKSVV